MPNYNFLDDHLTAIKTEKEISSKLYSFYGFKTEKFSDKNDFDIYGKTSDGKILKLEVKEDFTCERTGNVGLEFKCRGKPSGISVSKASHYIYKLHTYTGIEYYIISTNKLKDLINKKLYKKIVCGGDADSNSMNYIFGLDVFRRNANRIFG